MKHHKFNLIVAASVLLILIPAVHAQEVVAANDGSSGRRIAELEARVRELEDFVASLNNNFLDFSGGLEEELNDYKADVQKGLDQYSKSLSGSIDRQIRTFNDRMVVLNLASKGYRKIDTNSGVFLISIQKTKKINGGYQLIFHIGNPNFAGYKGLKLNLRWGRNWVEDGVQTWQQWRESLVGAQYAYNGPLEQGTWTELAVDIVPATAKDLEHIECALEVGAIQLNLRNPTFK